MGREYPLHPLVGVGAIIVEGDQVVVVRRGKPPAEGVWSIPGGALELGETLEDACRREVREETGLEVEIVSRCAVLDRITPDSFGRTRFHYVLIDYLCRPTGGTLCAGSDISEAMWHPLAGLETLRPMTAITAQVVLEAVRTLPH